MDKEYYDKYGGSVEVGSRCKGLYIEARVVASAIVGAIRLSCWSHPTVRETKYSHIRPLFQEKEFLCIINEIDSDCWLSSSRFHN